MKFDHLDVTLAQRFTRKSSFCRSLDECQCHPQGSLSKDCNPNGVCNCRLGIQGDKCDTCQDGFHRIDLGCIRKLVMFFVT